MTAIAISLFILTIFLVSPTSSAPPQTFRVNWDSSVLTADYGAGDTTAYNDGTPVDLISPGYGGAGGAIKPSSGQTLKYKIADNLDKEKGQIEMKFKLPFDLTGDQSKAKFNGPRNVFYDSDSSYLYVADGINDRIVKTKFDGTGWETLGSTGTGVGQLDDPHDVYYDPVSDYLYIADRANNRIIKTKMDGTGWTAYGSNGSGVGQFNSPCAVNYDSASGFLYICDRGNHRIIKTKMDGTGWTTYGTSGSGVGNFSNPRDLHYDVASDFVYVADSGNHRIVKTKMDGTGWASYGSSGNGVGKFNTPNGISFNSADSFIYVSDSANSRLVKTKIDGTGWTTKTGFNWPAGCYFDPDTDFNYLGNGTGVNYQIVKTKIDGTGWATYGSTGNPPSVRNLFRTSGVNPMWLNVSSDDGRFKFYVALGEIAYVAQSDPQTLSQDIWHTIKANYNNESGEVEILLDDVSLVSKTFSAWDEPSLGTYFYIGSDPDSASRALANDIDEFRLSSIGADIDPPTNPDTLEVRDKNGGSTLLTTNNWYNYPEPYFHWTGATDAGSGVQGYFVYFGTNASADPELAGDFQTADNYEPDFDLVNGSTYYLRIKTRDYAYNVSPSTWAPFVYKYDNDNPSQVEYINVDPPGPSTATSFDFDWLPATDATSGVKDYVYKLGSSGTPQSTSDTNLTGVAPYQEGDNILFLKPRDYAGNTPDSWQTAVYTTTTKVNVIDGPTTEVKSSFITVRWISDKQSTGYVLVYHGNDYVSEQGHTDLSNIHEVKVVGLDPETSYKFKLRTIDSHGNVAQSDWYKVTTAAPPRVSEVKIENIRQTEAWVSFKTSVAATTEIKWGTSSSYGKSATVTGAPNYATSHFYHLTNLVAGNNYCVGIDAKDEEGVSFFSDNHVFATPPYPQISDVQFEPVEDRPSTTIKVTWATNVPTSSQVIYAVEGKSPKESAKANLETEHEIEIADLIDSSTYKIRVAGRDQFGNAIASDEYTYLTPKDSRPPKIIDLVAEASTVGIGENSRGQIIVSWQTDEAATSQIEYGEGITGSFYAMQTKEDTFLVKDHLVIVSDLDPAKPYHFRAVSKDVAGNPAYSSDNTTITGKAKRSVLQIIIESFEKSFGWLKNFSHTLGF